MFIFRAHLYTYVRNRTNHTAHILNKNLPKKFFLKEYSDILKYRSYHCYTKIKKKNIFIKMQQSAKCRYGLTKWGKKAKTFLWRKNVKKTKKYGQNTDTAFIHL